MQKQLTFHGEAREAILNGVEKLAKAVVSTLGPKAVALFSTNPGAAPPSPKMASPLLAILI